MTTRSIAALGIAGTLIFAACSSSTEQNTKVSTNATAANGTTTSTASANPTNVNSAPIADGSVMPPQPVDANVPAAGTLEPPTMLRDKLKRARELGAAAGPSIDPREFALKNARPAPDNSTFASYLADAGYEIRSFKNHPQLLKVEKKISSDGKQSMKIFLRDGKVVELPGQRITVLATASAAHILEAAGIRAPAERAPSGPPPVKKSGE